MNAPSAFTKAARPARIVELVSQCQIRNQRELLALLGPFLH